MRACPAPLRPCLAVDEERPTGDGVRGLPRLWRTSGLRPQGPSSGEALLGFLQSTQVRGHAMIDTVFASGMSAMAAPVLRRKNATVGISIVGPSRWPTPARRHELAPVLWLQPPNSALSAARRACLVVRTWAIAGFSPGGAASDQVSGTSTVIRAVRWLAPDGARCSSTRAGRRTTHLGCLSDFGRRKAKIGPSADSFCPISRSIAPLWGRKQVKMDR